MEQLTIMIIDDDAVFQLINKKMIQNCDPACVVSSFLDPETALEYLEMNKNNRQQLPDIIFLDLNMPKLNGWQFLDLLELITLKKEINIIMLTSSISANDIKRAGSYSLLKGFESKPLTVEMFAEIRERTLKRMR